MDKELSGQKFKLVENGLDEAEVSSFIGSLTEQNATISKKVEHLDSLVNSVTERFDEIAQKLAQTPLLAKPLTIPTNEIDTEKLYHFDSLIRLAEKTITEADKQALTIKMEMVEKANSTASAIIAQAKEQAKAEAVQQDQSILKKAEEMAQKIKGPAE